MTTDTSEMGPERLIVAAITRQREAGRYEKSGK